MTIDKEKILCMPLLKSDDNRIVFFDETGICRKQYSYETSWLKTKISIKKGSIFSQWKKDAIYGFKDNAFLKNAINEAILNLVPNYTSIDEFVCQLECIMYNYEIHKKKTDGEIYKEKLYQALEVAPEEIIQIEDISFEKSPLANEKEIVRVIANIKLNSTFEKNILKEYLKAKCLQIGEFVNRELYICKGEVKEKFEYEKMIYKGRECIQVLLKRV